MKKLVLIALLLVAGYLKAQPPIYDDLRILYADGNYDKLVRAASGYNERDKTKGDALPYLWLGRGLYKIQASNNSEEQYKNAYKDAIGAVGRSIKLDKSGDLQEEYKEFYDEFKLSLVDRIKNDLSGGTANDYKKASAWVVKYYKLDMQSIGAKYLEGACKFRNNDKGGATAAWKDADAKFSKVTSIDGWSEADVELLKQGIIHSVDCLVSIKQGEKAKTMLGKAKQWYEDDEEFMAKYDAIVNK